MAAKKILFGFILFVWIGIWITFIIRGNKPWQYVRLRFFYAHSNHAEKIRYLKDPDFYDFLVFCKNTLPQKAKYMIYGFPKRDIKEFQARYFLWPLEMISENPDFKIFYHPLLQPVEGYKIFKQYKNIGFILIKEGEK
jgi:hypothetical protein